MEWFFPPTNRYLSQGFNDPAEEHFGSNRLEHTVRETIQNSLDAVDKNQRPVKIKICMQEIRPSEIGARTLEAHIRRTISALEGSSEEGARFYENALGILRQDRIPVLSIVDSNTTGLAGAKWDALVYREGTPNKDGMGAPGGSFGIGKNAPYTTSMLRMVCYATRYRDRNNRVERLIARCRLSTHQNPKKPSETLHHIGFGCMRSGDDPKPHPLEGADIPGRIFRLGQQGTGIFIIGFEHDAKRGRDWIKDATSYVAHHFFASIHDRKLEVTIGPSVIDHQTLDAVFEDGNGRDPSRHYYRSLTRPQTRTAVGNDLGNFELSLSVGDEGAPNRVAYVNRRGMLITDEKSLKKNPFRVKFGWARFSAVLVAADDGTDTRIRAMEPPDHQSIEYGRIRDRKKLAKTEKDLRHIQSKIHDFISSALDKNYSEQRTVLEEISEVLSVPGDDAARGGDDESDGQLLAHRVRTAPPRAGSPGSGDAAGAAAPGGAAAATSGPGTPHITHSGEPQGGERRDGPARPPAGSIRRGRVVRIGDTLRIAFVPEPPEPGDSVKFSIKPAGEERRPERELGIRTHLAITPPETGISIKDNTVCITPASGGQIILDVPVDGTRYTGYEIIETPAPRPPSGGEEEGRGGKP